jgi:hypothetical protein
MRRAAEISAAPTARHARDAPRPARVRDRGRAAARVRTATAPAPGLRSIVAERANACVLHYVENDAVHAGRRPAAHRRRLRARRLRLGHHAHLPGERPLQRPPEGRLRTRARRAGRRHRRVRPASLGTTPTTPPRACSSAASSTSDCCKGTRGWRARVRRLSPASTCTAPATGSVSTCTTRATTSGTASGACWNPA